MKAHYLILFSLQFLLISSLVYGEAPDTHKFQTLKLATGSNYFPFADKNMPDNGWSVTVVKTVFQQHNTDINIEILPWPRAYKWTKEAKYDAVFPYVYTEERARDMFYSEPINQIQVKLFVMADSKIQDFSHIRGKRFCIPKGFDFNPGPEHALHGYKLVRTQAEGILGCLRQVSKNWADIGFINAFYNRGILEKHFGFKHQIRILPEVVATVPLYLLVSKQHPQATALIKHFNQTLGQLRKNGELTAIKEQVKHWLETTPSQTLNSDN